MRASLRRAKAGGERFLGGMMPGATSRRLQVKAFADEWAAANIVAQHASGPLWVVLGDSTSQGVGATTRGAGYVGVVHEVLRRRDAWRVVNLSRAGASITDVLARQLPELTELTVEEPAALVTCIVGTEDVAPAFRGVDVALRSMLAAMPRGAVIGTVPLPGPAADAANAVIREEVVRHGLRLADLGAVKGGRRAAARPSGWATSPRRLGEDHGGRDRQPRPQLRAHSAGGDPAGRRGRGRRRLGAR